MNALAQQNLVLLGWLGRALRRAPQLALALAVVLGLNACAGGEDHPSATKTEIGVHAEPRQLVFHPDTGSASVELVNHANNVVPVADLRLEGADWESFAVTDGGDARALAPGERMKVTISADPTALEETDEETGKKTGEYREGKARLKFTAGGQDASVALRLEDPGWLSLLFLPALVKVLVLVMAFIMPLATLLTWVERKQSAMMQDRLGPNMASVTIGGVKLRLWGMLHMATDALKMLFKEDLVPSRVHKVLYTLAPALAFVPALAVFAIVPFGDGLCYDQLGEVLTQADVDQCVDGRGGTVLQVAHIDVGLLFYFAIASLATYGTTLAGWSSYNKWAILGGLRASAQMISYEVAIGLTIVGALLVYGTLEPHELVRAQLESHWGIVLQPIAFLLFFVAAMAETKRTPFDLPEGESEIIGYFVEYSGMRFGLFFLGEFIEIAFMSAMVATLFFGGWALPFGMLGASGFSSPLMAQAFFAGAGTLVTLMGIGAWRASPHSENFGVALIFVGLVHVTVAVWSLFTGWGTELPHIAIVLIGMITWGIKVAVLCWLQLLVRWTLPRFRYDQLMSLGWKGLLPLSLANIVLTAILVYLLMPGPESLVP